MSKDLKKIFIALFVLLLLVLIIVMSILSLKKNSSEGRDEYTQEDLNIIEDQVSSYLQDKIVPNGLSRMYGKYKGSNEFSDMYRSMYRFVNYLPTIVENNVYRMKEDDRSLYFDTNKEKILDNFGIESFEDFNAFVDYLEDNNYYGEKYLSCKVMPKEMTSEGGFFIVDIGFTFEGIEEPIVFTLHFANVYNNPIMVKYKPANVE